MEFDLHAKADGPNDPERCNKWQGNHECIHKRIPGSLYCALHGGASIIPGNIERSKRKYLGAQWQAQIGEFASDPEIKSLRQEIGITRLLLDKLLQRCQTDSDLLLRSSTMLEMIRTVERLVVSCHGIDAKIGVTLDKNQLVDFGSTVIEIVASMITDPAQMDSFIAQLTDAIAKAGTPEVEATRLLAQINHADR